MTELIAAGATILASGIAGLVAWGTRNQVSTLKAEVGRQLAEFRAALPKELNGTYRRSELCAVMMAPITERVGSMERRMEDLEGLANEIRGMVE